MSAKKSPYRPGTNYDGCFTFIRKTAQKGVTKAQILAAGYTPADMGVVISPQETSKNGDCRGNCSAQGHLYFVKRNSRKVIAGVKEVQRLSIGWRKNPLPKKVRGDKTVIQSETMPAKSKSKTKAKSKKTARV